MPAAIRAAPPAALEMLASSEAMPRSEQSMRARSQHQYQCPRDVVQCQHEAVLLPPWLVLACRLTKPSRKMARDANQPPGRSHWSPHWRLVRPLRGFFCVPRSGLFLAFLACTQVAATCAVHTRARALQHSYNYDDKRDSAIGYIHTAHLPQLARPQTHRPLLTIVAGAQTYGRHCVYHYMWEFLPVIATSIERL